VKWSGNGEKTSTKKAKNPSIGKLLKTRGGGFCKAKKGEVWDRIGSAKDLGGGYGSLDPRRLGKGDREEKGESLGNSGIAKGVGKKKRLVPALPQVKRKGSPVGKTEGSLHSWKPKTIIGARHLPTQKTSKWGEYLAVSR